MARGYLVWLWLCNLGSMTLTLKWPAVGAAVAFAAVAAAAVVVVVVVGGVVVVADRVAAIAVAVVLLVRVVVVEFALVVIVGWLSQSLGLLRSLFCVRTYWDVLIDNNVVLGVFAVYNLCRSNGLKCLQL